jgi:hypothetical protein
MAFVVFATEDVSIEVFERARQWYPRLTTI